MVEEYVEVLDKTGKKTGEQVTINEAHRNRIPHGVAVVFVFSADGRLYVQIRNEKEFRRDHTAAGHVDVGETFYDAAVREMKEEINLEVPIRFVADGISEDFQNIKTAKAHIFGIYETVAPETWNFTPNDEVADLLLMRINEIVDDMKDNPEGYTHGFRKTLETYVRERKK